MRDPNEPITIGLVLVATACLILVAAMMIFVHLVLYGGTNA